MLNILIILLLSIPMTLTSGSTEVTKDEICLNDKESQLYSLIMEYRKEKGLKPIPLSAGLTKVAQTHILDLNTNYDFSRLEKCNTHSWSRKGDWSSCCYTDDHKKAECMWDKPKEISGYQSRGYEIVSWEFPGEISAEVALREWKKSPGHNALLVNSGNFKQADWQAIGIGVGGNYASVWFGVLKDENTNPSSCN